MPSTKWGLNKDVFEWMGDMHGCLWMDEEIHGSMDGWEMGR